MKISENLKKFELFKEKKIRSYYMQKYFFKIPRGMPGVNQLQKLNAAERINLKFHSKESKPLIIFFPCKIITKKVQLLISNSPQ